MPLPRVLPHTQTPPRRTPRALFNSTAGRSRGLYHITITHSLKLFLVLPRKTVFKNSPVFPVETVFKIIQRFHWKHCLKIHRHVRKTMCSLHSTPREDLTDFLFPVHAILSRDSDDDGGQDGFFFPRSLITTKNTHHISTANQNAGESTPSEGHIGGNITSPAGSTRFP